MLATTEWLEKLSVLQAGCGVESHVLLPENSYSVGIDISEKQLDRNNYIMVLKKEESDGQGE